MASDASVEPGDDEVATAVGQYVLGRISLGKAAEYVDTTRWEFEALLREAGLTALYCPRSSDQLADEIDGALDLG